MHVASPTTEVSTEVLPHFRVVSERSQAPTDSSPITYREMALAVAEGTTESDAEAIARAECEVVRASLRGVPTGQFIQLAIFDHEFDTKPKRAPIVTLTFKDWQRVDGREAEPIIRFPLRERAASVRSGASSMAEDDITSVKGTPPPPPAAPQSAPEAPAPSAPTSAPEAPAPSVAPSTPRTGAPSESLVEPEPEPQPDPIPVPPPPPPVSARPPISVPSPRASERVPDARPSEPTSPGATVPIPYPPDSLTAVGPPPTLATPVEPEEVDVDPDPEPSETPTVPLETHGSAAPESLAPPSGPAIEIGEAPISFAPPASEELRMIAQPASVPSPPPPEAARGTSNRPPSSSAAPPGPVSGPPVPGSFGDRGVHPVVAVGSPESAPPPAVSPRRLPPHAVVAPPMSAPPAPPKSRPRTSGEDLIVELFEALSDLSLLHDPLEGADFVLRVALDNIPSALAMISFFSFDSRDFVVVRAAGENIPPLALQGVLLKRVGERAEIPLRAMRSQQTVVLDEDRAADALAADPRWRAAGILPLHYMCAPVSLGGRYLGLLEIANPCDGVRFSDADGHALTYMGQQLAEFLGQRDLVLDPERITAPKLHARVRRS